MGLIIPRMVINMDETKLRTIAQLQEFVAPTPEVSFTDAIGGGDTQRYEHISRVLKRFGYRHNAARLERGVVLAYLRRTSGYSRTQITRLVARWDENRLAPVPLAKRYGARDHILQHPQEQPCTAKNQQAGQQWKQQALVPGDAQARQQVFEWKNVSRAHGS